jgi:hypothetical protein
MELEVRVHPTGFKRNWRGLALAEVVVCLAVLGSSVAVVTVGSSKLQDDARVTQSMANLRNLGVANSTYAADWADRQFTAVPDDMGLAFSMGLGPVDYSNQIGCMPQQILGYDAFESLWAWWCAGDLCDGYPGSAAYWNNCFDRVYQPMMLNGRPSLGSFRLPNVKSFNAYVGDKYYDSVFWAPKDKVPLRLAKTMFAAKGEFGLTTEVLPGTWSDLPSFGVDRGIALSSYVWSPAAMWSPEVFSHAGYKSPSGSDVPTAWRSPTVAKCRFPSLKSRMIEHHWLQDVQDSSSPHKHEGDPTRLFNQGVSSVTVTLFFDGRVAGLSVGEAMISDTIVRNMAEMEAEKGPGKLSALQTGLWSRDTPLGPGGYFGEECIGGPTTGAHMLTTDGIMGRDVMNLNTGGE